jgi:pimeloyl-ACP methyl ester carboxylesterase
LPITFQVANAEKLSHKKELEEMVPLWDKIKAYCTILHGSKDELVFPSNALFAKSKLINASKVDLIMVPESGHDLSWTQPDLIKESILKTIETLLSDQYISAIPAGTAENEPF